MSADRVITLAQVRDVAALDQPAEPENTWAPLSLIDLAADPPQPPTIGGVLYPAERTLLSGETESMKTWFALMLAKAEMDIEIPVCWVDLDAMGPGSMLERLRLLGATDDQLHDLFLYLRPNEVLAKPRLDHLTHLVADRGVRLFVIDAFNPMLTLHGLDPNSTPDVEKFWRGYADPICHAGAAPVMLDHVPKNPEARGKYAYGSERKASGSIVHIGFKSIEAPTKGGKGRSLLTVHKDRHAHLPRPTLGRLLLDAVDPRRYGFQIEPDRSHDVDGAFRPTAIMEKISRQLEQENEPLSGKQIEQIKLGKSEYVRQALEQLAHDAYLKRQDGPRGANLYTTLRPFRESDQPLPTTSSRPRPDLVPDLTSRRPRPSSLPVGDEDVVRRRPGDADDLVPTPAEDAVIHEYDIAPDDDPGAWAQPQDLEPANGHDIWTADL